MAPFLETIKNQLAASVVVIVMSAGSAVGATWYNVQMLQQSDARQEEALRAASIVSVARDNEIVELRISMAQVKQAVDSLTRELQAIRADNIRGRNLPSLSEQTNPDTPPTVSTSPWRGLSR